MRFPGIEAGISIMYENYGMQFVCTQATSELSARSLPTNGTPKPILQTAVINLHVNAYPQITVNLLLTRRTNHLKIHCF